MSAVEVAAKVKVVPAKRSAVYSVPLSDSKSDDLIAEVRASDVRLKGGLGRYVDELPKLPKTLAAVDAAVALLNSVRNELIEQDITE